MRLARMHAGGEGIQPPDPMREALRDQKIERAVGHGRLLSKAGLRQFIKDFVGADRAMRLQQDFQGLTPHRRQAQTARGGQRLGMGQHPGTAPVMIVPCECDCGPGLHIG